MMLRFLCIAVILLVSSEVGPASAQRPIDSPEEVSGKYLNRSDVLLSPRFYRSEWKRAFDAFHANRIVWTYAGKRYLEEAAGLDIEIQCALPYFVPDSEQAINEMACLDGRGVPIDIVFFDPKTSGGSEQSRVVPDVTRPAWQAYILREAKRLISAGCLSFQQDNAWQNATHVGRGGCRPPNAEVSFRRFAKENTGVKGRKPSYGEFQRSEVAKYHAWLHNEMRAFAGATIPRRGLSFSANVSSNQLSRSRWIIPSFDFLISEIYGTRSSMLQSIRDVAAVAQQLEGPSAVTFASADTWLNQRAIATSYALGLVPLVPWDVFLGTQQSRYYGDPDDFARLFKFVRKNSKLFDRSIGISSNYNDYNESVPFEGLTTKVSRSRNADHIEVDWTGGDMRKVIKKGEAVRVGNAAHVVVAESANGKLYLAPSAKIAIGERIVFGSMDILVVRAKEQVGQSKSVIHLVNWGNDRVLWLDVPISDSEPPQQMMIPGDTQPRHIKPFRVGATWRYKLGRIDTWAIVAN